MIPWQSVKSLASKLEIDEFTILREYLQVLFLRYSNFGLIFAF